MLVAAKVDPENPHRAAKFINSHPGVSHNYLRNHDFNIWFTLATEPGSKLGLDGTLEVMQAKTGAHSIRQLPTLKLFKIRMDLEMEGDTRPGDRGRAVEPRQLDPIELSDDDVELIRATQGPMPAIAEPYAPAAERLGVPQDEVLRRLESLRERNGLRRVAAILFHRPTNMLTGAALATINRLPVLLLPSDTFATRVSAPVLQDLEQPHDNELTVNDAFEPIIADFDRVWRPEQLPSALLGAMRVLTDPVETGAATIALPGRPGRGVRLAGITVR